MPADVQATFPYLDVWLGVVMVYQAANYRQEVHCQLVYSNDTVNWNRLEPGADLIPLCAHFLTSSMGIHNPLTNGGLLAVAVATTRASSHTSATAAAP